jgi:hypothetical protein
MNENRRQFVASAVAAGTGLAAASALLINPKEASAQAVESAPQWQALELGRTYKVNAAAVVIACIIKHIENGGDFRGAIHGKVDGQLRGAACAGWGPSSGMSCNSFVMFANRNQRFDVSKVDDQVPNYGRAWTVQILVSGPCQLVS